MCPTQYLRATRIRSARDLVSGRCAVLAAMRRQREDMSHMFDDDDDEDDCHGHKRKEEKPVRERAELAS